MTLPCTGAWELTHLCKVGPNKSGLLELHTDSASRNELTYLSVCENVQSSEAYPSYEVLRRRPINALLPSIPPS